MSAHYAQIKEICDALYDTKEGLTLDRIFEQTQLPKSEVIIHYKTWRSEAAKRFSPSQPRSLVLINNLSVMNF